MRKVLYGLVIAIGLLRIVGWLVDSAALKGLGAVSAAAPLPIVFTEVKGVETFASDVDLVYIDAQGHEQALRITPAIYGRLKGPYNRRNVFGAAIAYGPVLEEALWQRVLGHGLCSGVLQEEMGLPADMHEVRFVLRTRTAGRTDQWTLRPSPCP